MSVHSATQLSAALSSSFDVGDNTLKAAQPISVNKNFDSSMFAGKRTFTPEKGLADVEYIYIVHLENDSVAMYDGGVKGLEATNPNMKMRNLEFTKRSLSSQKLNVNSPDVVAYSSFLEGKQRQVISKIKEISSNAEVVSSYKLALNGMAVRMYQAEAELVSRLPGVKFVERDQLFTLDTDTGPSLIGAPSVWDGSATDSGVGAHGEGVVVGIIDSGVNTDHPSFADVSGDGYDHDNPLGSGNYLGDCAGDYAELCNDKLIGVYSYPVITDNYDDTTVFPVDLPENGEDYGGHGTHVASTAAGNILFDVPEVTPEFGVEESSGIPTGFVFDRISGVAPRANIISYQVCFGGRSQAGDTYGDCPGAAIAAGIESALADGVDVINYSISGGGFSWGSSTELAYLAARNAGIFVATSAGNGGPGASTTPKHAPWYTAVAAAEHGRTVAYDKSIGDFAGGDSELGTLTGASNSGGITASIVYAGDFENPNDPDGDSAQCLQPFPADTFSGEIVVCDRGAIARVQKAINVADGGAAGYVLANLDGGATSVNSDAYVVPGIHIDSSQGDMLRTWLASGEGHSATIAEASGELVIDDSRVDVLAGFSSKGPSGTISTLTPTVTGPGVNIYAAYADQHFGHDGNGPAPSDYDYLSGTSMSSPHVAGAAALVKSAKPGWSPDNIRSALAMTATPTVKKEDGVTAGDWFDMGSGRIQVDQAVKAGLVMDESADNYTAANPNEGGEPRSLNLPSVTDWNCVGTCTWTRTVTATKAGSWTASGASVSGNLDITVTPASFELVEGESQEISVSVNAFNSPSDIWSFGIVNLTSGTSPDLHLPVSVIASNGNLPSELAVEAKRNQDSYLLKDLLAVEITDFTVNSYGLTKATVVAGSAALDSDNSSVLDDLTDGLFIATADIPEDAKRLVVMTSNSTSPDLDLFVIGDFNGDGIPTADEIVASSATATADETVDIALPAAAMYWMVVQNWAASAEGATDTFDLSYALVDGTPGDNLMVDGPAAVAQLTPFDIRVTWDLADGAEGDMYFGAVDLGTSAENAGNLGLLPVDVMRAGDDVNVVSDVSERAEPGDVLEFAVAVDANFTTEDRDYEVSLTLPEGVTLMDGSTAATVDGTTLSWMVSKPSLLGAEPSYSVTTNATDAACAIPFGDGSYIDLAGFGIGLQPIDGDTQSATYNIQNEFLGEVYSSFTLTDDGFITLTSDTGTIPYFNQLIPEATAPNAVIAPFWRDMQFDTANGSGVSVATAGSLTIIEYDDMQPWIPAGATPFGDVADFQIAIANGAAADAPNIIFSYANMTHVAGDSIPTTIGYENAAGTKGLMTHYIPGAFGGAQVGSVASDAVDGTQICFYLQPVPDQPELLSFSVMVNEDYLGGPLPMMAMSSVPNIPGTTTVASEIFDDVQVEGAPQVTIAGEAIATMEVLELRELDLPGAVVEPNGDDFDIVWTQVGGPAAVIAGNGLADAVLIAPEVTEDTMVVLEMTATDSNGNASTAVANVMILNNQAPTVTVTAPSSVEEGATISLSVATSDPEGDDVSVTINGIAGTSYTTTAPGTNENTVVTFQVVASDGLNETTQTVSVTVTAKKGGGSMGWIALLLIPAIWLRRRKLHQSLNDQFKKGRLATLFYLLISNDQ